MGTVLIVDDEQVIRRGCERAFGSAGFRVLTADNGQEALEILVKEKVDAILCDLKMPVMGAVEVMKAIKDLCVKSPLIIITGQGTVANAIECMKAGAYDFITKPFRVEELIALVRNAVDGKPPPSRFPGNNLPF